MKILIDGVEVPIQNDVKIIVELEDDQELHITAGADGISYDVIEKDEIVAGFASDWADLMEEALGEEQDEGRPPEELFFGVKDEEPEPIDYESC